MPSMRLADIEKERLNDAINILLDWFRMDGLSTMQLCKIRQALRLSYLLGMETEADSHALFSRMMKDDE